MNKQAPTIEEALDASPERSHDLLLNLRSLGSADTVREIVERCVRRLDAAKTDLRTACFHRQSHNQNVALYATHIEIKTASKITLGKRVK